MIEVAGLGSFVVVAAILGWVTGVIAAAFGAKFLLSDRSAPAPRCRRVERLALLPLVGAVLGAVALLLPALLKAAGLIDDHCLVHGLHHPHFCLRHLPAFAPGPATAVLLVVGVCPVFALFRVVLARFREARLVAGIVRMTGTRFGVTRVDLAAPRAFLFGLRRPRIVLSAGLLRVLAPSERRAVVRHEIAHARAGDPGRRFVLGFLFALHLPATRRRLERCWHQAAEERADDRVAERGQGLELARALVKILRERNTVSTPVATALAADSGDVARRIRRLAGGSRDARRDARESPWFERLLAVTAVLAVVAVTSRHHAIETAVGWLIG